MSTTPGVTMASAFMKELHSIQSFLILQPAAHCPFTFQIQKLTQSTAQPPGLGVQ